MKKIPLRLRLTLLSVLLLTLCCTGLTVILNFSANQMANTIEAIPVIPANEAPGAAFPQYPGYSAAPIVSEASKAARSTFLSQSIFYSVLIISLGGILTYYLSGKALRPLRELSEQMKNRSVHNLSETIPVPESRDEVSELTNSFNQMSAKLDEAFAMQKRFSQSAAHELRTPLAVLKTKVHVFRKKSEHSPDEYENLLSVVSSQTDRLSDLVNDLLSLTNMDELTYDEKIELKAMLSDIAKEFSVLSEERGVSVRVSGEEQTVTGNANLLRRAFENLIENAVKYNTENGKVDISISKTSCGCKISIADTGIGIPDDMKSLVFEPFFRTDKSRSRKAGGSGLGLSIVKSIIEKHEGKISLSDDPSGGSIFEITL